MRINANDFHDPLTFPLASLYYEADVLVYIEIAQQLWEMLAHTYMVFW